MSDPLFSVADQVVLVTGASRGIGRAIAQGFVARGSHVVICGRQEETLQTAASEMQQTATGTVTPIVCDLAQPDDIARLVEQTLEQQGRIDTLVNVTVH